MGPINTLSNPIICAEKSFFFPLSPRLFLFILQRRPDPCLRQGVVPLSVSYWWGEEGWVACPVRCCVVPDTVSRAFISQLPVVRVQKCCCIALTQRARCFEIFGLVSSFIVFRGRYCQGLVMFIRVFGLFVPPAFYITRALSDQCAARLLQVRIHLHRCCNPKKAHLVTRISTYNV
jgi:hypothetical protein